MKLLGLYNSFASPKGPRPPTWSYENDATRHGHNLYCVFKTCHGFLVYSLSVPGDTHTHIHTHRILCVSPWSFSQVWHHRLTVLPHELVEPVQSLRVFRRRMIWRMLLWTRAALLWMRGRRLAAVAAHKRGQDGGIVHAPVQPPQ